jgi:hypothetical protein
MHYAGLSRFFAKKVDYVSGHSSAIYYRIELVFGILEPTQWALQEMYQGSKSIGGHLRELGSKNPIFWRFFTVFVEKWNFFDANIFLEFFWRRNLIEEVYLRDPTENRRYMTVNKRENGRQLRTSITTSGLNQNRKYIFFLVRDVILRHKFEFYSNQFENDGDMNFWNILWHFDRNL